MNTEPRKCAKAGCERTADPRAIFCADHHRWAINEMMNAIQAGVEPEQAVGSVLAQGKESAP